MFVAVEASLELRHGCTLCKHAGGGIGRSADICTNVVRHIGWYEVRRVDAETVGLAFEVGADGLLPPPRSAIVAISLGNPARPQSVVQGAVRHAV